MAPAAPGLAGQLDTVTLKALAFPVVSNVTAEPISDLVRARRLLIEQLTSPVRWSASMQSILGAGVREFIELGPGDVLSGLLKRIDRAASCRTLGTVEQVEAA
jgi:[acyl-carrier-protein] S-malonyltransferase